MLCDGAILFIKERKMERTQIIETKSGKVVGKVIDGLNYFEGIPYGVNTGGENRFLPPKNSETWNDVKECFKVGDRCVQAGGAGDLPIEMIKRSPLAPVFENLSGFHPEVIQSKGMSENCLCLNVVTPSFTGKRPVLFYIHGGAFTGGDGGGALSCEKLCKEQDVVVCSMNERLNIFGYLYLGDFDEKYKDSGVLGLLDIIKALEWVRDNIERFGGDPNNVTLFGESGGAMKISCLLAMEKAKGLFRKAIMNSGAAPVGAYSKENATKTTKNILKYLGIEECDYEKLLSVPCEKLLEASTKKELFAGGGSSLEFQPVGDGINLPENPENKFLTYEWSKDIPVIVGSSEDECGISFVEFGLTKEQAIERLANGTIHSFGKTVGIGNEAAKELYETFEGECKKGELPYHIFIKVISNISLLGFGAYEYALERARSGGKAYLYVTAMDNDVVKGFPCSFHTADLMAVFRNTTNDRYEKFSKNLWKMYGEFLRNGSPYEEIYGWKAFDEKESKMMILDDEFRFAEDPMKNSRSLVAKYNRKFEV